MVDPRSFCPVSNETVIDVDEHVFAPWVKDLGLAELRVSRGQASARLPANPKLDFSSGAVCGQVIMAAVDTVVSLAMFTTDRLPRGTVYQHTHFLRAAVNDDFLIEAKVLPSARRPRMRRQRSASPPAQKWLRVQAPSSHSEQEPPRSGTAPTVDHPA